MAFVPTIIGWSSSDKVPGYYAYTQWGVGRASIGDIAIVCALTGTKTSDGSMTADLDVLPAYSLQDAIDYCGARSTIVQQAKAAFAVPGTNVILAPPAETAGTAAHITVTFTGSVATAGSVPFWLNGERFEVAIGSSDTVTDIGDTFVEALGALTTAPATATNATGAVTVNIVSKGTQGNNYLLGWDESLKPSTLTVSVAGATALHARLVPFTGGAGTESVDNIINLLENNVYDYIAVAQTDTTNAGKWKTHVMSEEAPTIAHLEHLVFGSNGTLASAISFASVTLNCVRAAVVWYENCETHPAVMAANAAAYRSSVVGANPNSVYAGVAMTAIAPQRYTSDAPNHNTLMAALNAGVTPLEFSDGFVRINRDCLTKCLTGSTPNYNTYAWADADVTDRMRREWGAVWKGRQAGNPNAGPDPAAGEKTARSGLETPSTLQGAVRTRWKECEELNWITSVDDNPPIVTWDATRKCLVGLSPVIRMQHNLQAGNVVQQTAI